VFVAASEVMAQHECEAIVYLPFWQEKACQKIKITHKTAIQIA
jgi:hypothetical protein